MRSAIDWWYIITFIDEAKNQGHVQNRFQNESLVFYNHFIFCTIQFFKVVLYINLHKFQLQCFEDLHQIQKIRMKQRLLGITDVWQSRLVGHVQRWARDLILLLIFVCNLFGRSDVTMGRKCFEVQLQNKRNFAVHNNIDSFHF